MERTISHYRILGPLGKGGMGELLLAEDTTLQRKVAIKFLRSEFTADEPAKKRLVAEARAIATLDHPNICSIYEVGEENGHSFIAMQYVEGETLAERTQGRRLDLPEVLSVARQMADALSEAHTHRILHRDIKPQNVMITPRGQVKVLDFGIAKIMRGNMIADAEAATVNSMTATGSVIGTVPYMSPEQVRGEELDARSDIFSFGVVLYELLSGRNPFAGKTSGETAAAILTREPEALRDAPARVQRIVESCLKKDPAQRFQSMRDVLTALVDAAQTGDSGTKPKRRSVVPLALTALLLLAAAVTISFLRGRTNAPATSSFVIKSVAVLPLANLSGDPEQDYFADGITGDLINSLAQVGALRVTSRTSVMAYKGSRKSLPDIARELNVDAVVEGTIARSGNRVKINAQLIHAAGEQNLWAKNYERDISDVLSLQDELARSIANEIRIQLSPQETTRLGAATAVNSEAYDVYLKGRFHAQSLSKSENEKAVEMLERAVSIDPSFAIAQAALAGAYAIKYQSFAPEDRQWEEKGYVAVEKALALNPNLAEAYIARGILLWTSPNHFPHDKAVAEFRRALSLNPNHDEAHHQLGLIYIHVGLLDKSDEELNATLAINPSHTLARFRTGIVQHLRGHYEQALGIVKTVPPESYPATVNRQLAWTLFNLGRTSEAAAVIDESLRRFKDDGGQFVSMQAMFAAAAGDQAKAEEKIKLAAAEEKGYIHFHHTAYNNASAYALMGKVEPALKWLQKAADDGYPCYPLFENDPNLKSLRNDARFIAFMAKLKEQWERYKATL